MEVFYRKRNGAREVIAKKEKEIFRPGHLFGAKGRVFVFVFVFFYCVDCFFPSGRDGKGPCDRLPHWC